MQYPADTKEECGNENNKDSSLAAVRKKKCWGRIEKDEEEFKLLIWKQKEVREGWTGCCFLPQDWKAESKQERDGANLTFRRSKTLWFRSADGQLLYMFLYITYLQGT